ncbi:MAG: alanine racemase, partial [Chthoniobacterales bacterium]
MPREPLPPQRRSWVEIDLSALRHNAQILREHLSAKNTKPPAFIAVVKADAYGHGATRVAKELAPDVHAFAVASVREALEISFCKKDILLLGPTIEENLHEALWANLIFTVSSREELRHLSKQRKISNTPTPGRLHLKLDTGMGRVGCHRENVSELLSCIEHASSLPLFSIG